MRAAIGEAVQARADGTTVTIEELDVREWADVRPGVVWVRVFVRCSTDSPDAWSVTNAGPTWMEVEWHDNRALRDGVVLTFDLERRDADWHVVRDWHSDVTEETE